MSIAPCDSVGFGDGIFGWRQPKHVAVGGSEAWLLHSIDVSSRGGARMPLGEVVLVALGLDAKD